MRRNNVVKGKKKLKVKYCHEETLDSFSKDLKSFKKLFSFLSVDLVLFKENIKCLKIRNND